MATSIFKRLHLYLNFIDFCLHCKIQKMHQQLWLVKFCKEQAG